MRIEDGPEVDPRSLIHRVGGEGREKRGWELHYGR